MSRALVLARCQGQALLTLLLLPQNGFSIKEGAGSMLGRAYTCRLWPYGWCECVCVIVRISFAVSGMYHVSISDIFKVSCEF